MEVTKLKDLLLLKQHPVCELLKYKSLHVRTHQMEFAKLKDLLLHSGVDVLLVAQTQCLSWEKH